MNTKHQRGFSLIELLIVVVIIGIIAAIAIPFLLKAKEAAENRSAVALLSTMRSSQMTFYAQKGRYGDIQELQESQNGSLGMTTASGATGTRGNFNYAFTTLMPSEKYLIIATRNDLSVAYTLEEDGVITNIGF